MGSNFLRLAKDDRWSLYSEINQIDWFSKENMGVVYNTEKRGLLCGIVPKTLQQILSQAFKDEKNARGIGKNGTNPEDGEDLDEFSLLVIIQDEAIKHFKTPLGKAAKKRRDSREVERSVLGQSRPLGLPYHHFRFATNTQGTQRQPRSMNPKPTSSVRQNEPQFRRSQLLHRSAIQHQLALRLNAAQRLRHQTPCLPVLAIMKPAGRHLLVIEAMTRFAGCPIPLDMSQHKLTQLAFPEIILMLFQGAFHPNSESERQVVIRQRDAYGIATQNTCMHMSLSRQQQHLPAFGSFDNQWIVAAQQEFERDNDRRALSDRQRQRSLMNDRRLNEEATERRVLESTIVLIR